MNVDGFEHATQAALNLWRLIGGFFSPARKKSTLSSPSVLGPVARPETRRSEKKEAAAPTPRVAAGITPEELIRALREAPNQFRRKAILEFYGGKEFLITGSVTNVDKLLEYWSMSVDLDSCDGHAAVQFGKTPPDGLVHIRDEGWVCSVRALLGTNSHPYALILMFYQPEGLELRPAQAKRKRKPAKARG